MNVFKKIANYCIKEADRFEANQKQMDKPVETIIPPEKEYKLEYTLAKGDKVFETIKTTDTIKDIYLWVYDADYRIAHNSSRDGAVGFNVKDIYLMTVYEVEEIEDK